VDIFEIAAWAAVGSFMVAVAGIVLKIWRMKMRSSDKPKRPRK